MSEDRKQIKSIYLDADVHDMLSRMASKRKLDLNELIEETLTHIACDAAHNHKVDEQLFAGARIFKNLRERPAK